MTYVIAWGKNEAHLCDCVTNKHNDMKWKKNNIMSFRFFKCHRVTLERLCLRCLGTGGEAFLWVGRVGGGVKGQDISSCSYSTVMFTSNVVAKCGITIMSPALGGSPFKSISEPCLFAGSLRQKQHFPQKYAATGWIGKPCFARSIAGWRRSFIDNYLTKMNIIINILKWNWYHGQLYLRMKQA